MMRYPNQYALRDEAKEIRVGDLVWWNEGVCIGFVVAVMEGRDEYESWGLNEPCIALTNLHPFEANEATHKQHIGFVTNGGTIVCPLNDLENEGIGLLTEHERAELDWAIAEAKARAAVAHRDLPLCVSAVMDMERHAEDWIFHFVDGECRILETVVFPFRPNTRNRIIQAGTPPP